MTLLALAGKWPAFAWPKILPSVRSDASAILPSPTPQRLKKWRRVTNCSRRSSLSISLLPCQKIVQIQQHSRHACPGCQQLQVRRQVLSELVWKRILGKAVRLELPAFVKQLGRQLRIGFVLVQPRREITAQTVRLLRMRRPSHGQQECVVQPFAIVLRRLFEDALRQALGELEEGLVIQRGQRLQRSIRADAARAS